MSHLVQVRGLKHGAVLLILRPIGVAPRAGAWIETRGVPQQILLAAVAPRAGAWIETQLVLEKFFCEMSHLVQVRGLKPAGTCAAAL